VDASTSCINAVPEEIVLVEIVSAVSLPVETLLALNVLAFASKKNWDVALIFV